MTGTIIKTSPSGHTTLLEYDLESQEALQEAERILVEERKAHLVIATDQAGGRSVLQVAERPDVQTKTDWTVIMRPQGG